MAEIRADDRPRERLQRLGPHALTDAELVALVLRSGRRGESALDLAAGLLNECCGLSGLAATAPDQMVVRPGLGPAKAAALLAAFELGLRVDIPDEREEVRRAYQIDELVRGCFTDWGREQKVILILDSGNRAMRKVVLPPGGPGPVVAPCSMPVQEVLATVLRHDGVGFALAHNHPSGRLRVTNADVEYTKLLADGAEAAELFFTAKRFASLRELGYFDW
jgi:DNA repair protein RadC